MLYFSINGFFTADSTKEAGFTSAPKQEWQLHESGREYSILDVDEMVKLGNNLFPVEEGISVRYVWRDEGSTKSHIKGALFAQREHNPKKTLDTSAV